MKRLFSSTGKFVIGLLIITWSVVPILLVVLSAFKLPKDIFSFPPSIIFHPTLENFVKLGKEWPQFFNGMLNSTIVTLGAAAVTVIVSFLAGYAYSRYRSKTLTSSAFFLLIIRMFPPIVISIPLYPIVQALNLFDRRITLVIFYSVFFISLGTWLMKTFIDQIPRELEESAYLDGASLFQTMRHIILPLSTHGMVATSTFVIIFSWKEYLFAKLFTATYAKTAPLILSEMLNSVSGVEWGPLFAAGTIQLLPLLIYVFFVQRFLIEGATIGSVKG